MNISKRNTALDIVRIVAFFSVAAIHFWLHNGYYNEPIVGKPMFVYTTIRTAFTYCVPLFIILSGYLLNKKTLSKRYYLGIVKILGIYILATIGCMLFKHRCYGDEFTFRSVLFGILDFSGANYSWYIEMYIGLFLLIPFLNTMYHGLKGKGQKKVLIWTLVCLTSLPSIINIYNFTEPGWFYAPAISREYQKLAGEWWVMIYPVTYYMIGAYLKEYPFKMKKRYNLLLFFLAIAGFGLFNYYRNHGAPFFWDGYRDWFGAQALVLSVLIFSLLSRINTEKFPNAIKKTLAHLSDLCLGAYLMSYVADSIIYPYLARFAPTLDDKFGYFIPAVLSVIAASLLMSEFLNLLYKAMEWIWKSTANVFSKKKNHQKPNKT